MSPSNSLSQSLSDALYSPQPLNWVFTGDSITQGVKHTHGARSWVEHVHERVRWQFGRHRDVMINTAIAGWTAPQVLREFDHLIGRFSPDLVSIGLGMNDSMAGHPGLATFVDALGELTRACLELEAFVVLHTPNTIALGAFNTPEEVAAYAEAIRHTAAELDTFLVDHHQAWVDHFQGNAPQEWLDEPVHPNAEGHLQMANLTLHALELGPPMTFC